MSVSPNWNKLNGIGSDEFLYPGQKLILRDEPLPVEKPEEDPEEIDSDEMPSIELDLHRKRSNSMATIMKGKKDLEESKKNVPKRKTSDTDLEVIEEDGKSLRDRMKDTLKSGGISDIDKIFQHVMSESKRVIESLQSVQTDQKSESKTNQSFLNFYENASNGMLDEKMKDFIEVETTQKIVKSEAYYCTKHGRIKGVITVGDTFIMYDPLYWDENDKFDQEVLGSKFQACIDFKDIVNVDVIKLPNETAMYIEDDEDRKWYLYDYYLQFSVSVVNAKTLSKMLGNQSPDFGKRKRRRRPVATVFFRFSHRDKDGVALKNKDQSSIIEIIKKDVENKMGMIQHKNKEGNEGSKELDFTNLLETTKDPSSKDEEEKAQKPDTFDYKPKDSKYEEYSSSTYIPYYDVIKKDVGELKEDEFELVNTEELTESNQVGDSKDSETTSPHKKDGKPAPLPKSENHPRFMPICNGESAIMSDTQIMMIARLLPPLFRMREWIKVFSIDEDGISLQTFYKNAKGYYNNMLFVEDIKGNKFGAYLCEEWSVHKHFYGTGESFLFTFKDSEEDVQFFKWTSYNDHIQYSDESSIAVGGADGKFALFIRNNFLDGMSHSCKTFENVILASGETFQWKHLELWGFEY